MSSGKSVTYVPCCTASLVEALAAVDMAAGLFILNEQAEVDSIAKVIMASGMLLMVMNLLNMENLALL